MENNYVVTNYTDEIFGIAETLDAAKRIAFELAAEKYSTVEEDCRIASVASFTGRDEDFCGETFLVRDNRPGVYMYNSRIIRDQTVDHYDGLIEASSYEDALRRADALVYPGEEVICIERVNFNTVITLQKECVTRMERGYETSYGKSVYSPTLFHERGWEIVEVGKPTRY